MAYAHAKGIDLRWLGNLFQHTLQPHLEILIDIPAEVSVDRKGKFGANDKYESDLKFLRKVRDCYKILYSSNFVNGLNDPNMVHEDIWSIVKETI
ncbi:dTMP kinase [Brevibacillus migulae]|uniref:dTMP kinase n=1 Tax=Brevibacillus migulae TaxID=1644114 RepID=UPI00106ED4D5